MHTARKQTDLAYLIAIGNQRYRLVARAAAESLLKAGAFQGEVVIFSDRQFRVPKGVRVIVVDEPELLQQPKRLKLRAREYIDFDNYRYTMFLDADVLTRAPLMSDFHDIMDQGALVCTDDINQTIDQGLCYRCLHQSELDQHAEKTLGVNSGFFMARGDQLSNILTTWEGILKDHLDSPGPGFDQPGLNAGMIRGAIPVYIVPGLMWFPRFDPRKAKVIPNPPLIHFHGAGRKWSRVLKMIRLSKSAPSKTRAERETKPEKSEALRKALWKIYFKLTKITQPRTVSSFYRIKLLSNHDDRTFKFYVTGRYGSFLWKRIEGFQNPFIYLDIGANQGLFTIVAGKNKNSQKVYAFEPIEATANLLTENVELNNISDKTQVVVKAISDTSTTRRIAFNQAHSGTATLERHSQDDSIGENHSEVVTINRDQLDQLVSERNVPIVVKIDVEGHEKTVLEEVLMSNLGKQVKEIFLEVDERWIDKDELFKNLQHRGFEILKVGSGSHYDICATRTVTDTSEKRTGQTLSTSKSLAS